MEADVNSRWALGRLCNGHTAARPQASRLDSDHGKKRAHKANDPQRTDFQH
jgi:hypothetical protein